MLFIAKKDITQFFSSLTGYVSIIIFLLVTGFYLFVLPESNILYFGYASLDKFFDLAPWVLMLLVPAITMRSLSEEYRIGTFETLKTRPLRSLDIALGKYLAILAVLFIVLIPTLIYVFTIKNLSTTGAIDSGAIIGSYIGLFFLGAVFAAISLCCSSFSSNAVVAFLVGIFACVKLYYGFNALSKMSFLQGAGDYFTEIIGIDYHYRSVSKGVIDSRDIIYFLSVISFCLLLTVFNLNRRGGKR